ncbi:MAG: twin-arginine translocation pathway signal protein [Natronospirillum sp.]|uniref:Acg family FMN-binding oxidoreductase n=1 Tax=Natronospirillum sp. TaxID=2812955 RepID=UPI0025D8607D|nr:twin-arginine translocation pathway signal protein [Natronospirillum sp.]MCH8551250.1 twin-arginine translocation pathway signal protein [Natronospirillum sp.]
MTVEKTGRKLSRRNFIALAGGGVVLAVGAGIGAFSLTRTPNAALAPWAQAGQYTEPRRFALSHAILAPNAHNLQPWMVDLSEPGIVTLLPDPTRRLPATDPFDRQLTISLGCFLEQMTIAASAAGYRVETELFPEGSSAETLGDRPVARSRFIEADIATDPLFAQIPHRRSTKDAFDMQQPVAASLLGELEPEVSGIRFDGTVEQARVDRLRTLIWEAWETEYSTPAAHHESVGLMRLGKTEINSNPDGISVGGMPLEALISTGVVTREALATPGTMAYQAGIDMYQPVLEATPAFVWLTSVDNTRESHISAGRAWLRLNLLTTANGLALHPVSQCLQEYPEMEPHYQSAHQLLAQEGDTVQMLGRLGYAAPPPPSPRWSLDDKIKHA